MAIVRGNTVVFREITFTNQEGTAIEPDTATLLVRYPVGSGTEEEEVTLTLEDDLYSGSWDSSVSDAGMVTWTLTGATDELSVVRDGTFRLTWNKANEEAGG